MYHTAFCQAQQHPQVKNLSLAHAALLQEGRSNPAEGCGQEDEEQQCPMNVRGKLLNVFIFSPVGKLPDFQDHESPQMPDMGCSLYCFD